MKPTFFSRYEWWYHTAVMPVFLLAINSYFAGKSYFTDPHVFFVTTVLGVTCYWIYVIAITITVRDVIARFPRVDQTVRRLTAMLLLVGLLISLLSGFMVWAYSILPQLAVTMDLGTVIPVMIAGIVVDIFICAVLGLFYSLEQWRKNQAEIEKLERLALQNQFDALKGQVNPHFLFNSLNTLSSLIGADQQQAEDFVEDLARIYRYMLQAAKTELVPLQTELTFLTVLARLLKVRYQDGLQIIQPSSAPQDLLLPPLSLQVLVDNAIHYNTLSASKPLIVRIELTEDRSLRITNDIQARHRTLSATNVGLRGLAAKYETLTSREVVVEQSGGIFTVTIPLLTHSE
ncbi:sensor histidine kinase [Dyadobacter sp. MSC1_007]|jgi:sensor histidine kinase YesM|uniref:sensor histidine kinase n=1 Tax=Dyadobacter sp. MSC1_007 TaxID=2909264 RepID=UPI00202E8251|nr:histidine kinase [Dyadobacter sp. MSC1_007]